MKRILSLIIIGALIFSGLSIGAVSNISYKEKILNESIKISQPKILYDEEFSMITFDESTSYLINPGKPMIPIITKVYTLPFGSTIESVDVSFSESMKLELSKEIKPCPQNQPMSLGINILKDESVYESNELYPENSFSYNVGTGLNKEEHVVYLSIQYYPIKYNPVKNEIYYSENANIEIIYNEPSSPVNFADEYDLVIVTTESFSSNLQSFIDHKNNHGINTTIKNAEEIYNEYQGRDNPEKIKYFIKDAIETWGISYVLLIGEVYQLPIRYTTLGVWHDEEDVPTDLYYADIYDENGDFCSWDSNNNDIFGEFDWEGGPIDDVDLYADVYIGRIPCKTNNELQTVIGKIINYETNAYGQSWFNNLIVMGGDTFPNHGIIEGEYVTDRVMQEMDGFNPINLWTSEDNFNSYIINQNIKNGAGFISYSGHGYANGFGTSPPDVERRIEYYNFNLLFMWNNEKLPVIFFDACLTTKLDFNRLFGFLKLPCFAWNLLKKSNGGAIATVGATRVAFTHVDQQGIHGGASLLNLEFFKAYEEGTMVSHMLTQAQSSYIQKVGLDCFTIEEFILLGDPSLKIGGYIN